MSNNLPREFGRALRELAKDNILRAQIYEELARWAIREDLRTTRAFSFGNGKPFEVNEHVTIIPTGQRGVVIRSFPDEGKSHVMAKTSNGNEHGIWRNSDLAKGWVNGSFSYLRSKRV